MVAEAPTTSVWRNARSVAQYDTAGRKLAEFPTIAAAARANGIHPANITAAANGRIFSTGGFLWRTFTDTAPDTVEVRRKYRRKSARRVVQYDASGNKVAEHESSVVAARAVGVSASGIINAANEKHRTAAGFSWMWADDDQHLWHEYGRTRDVEIRNRLIERFHPLMLDIAHAFRRRLPRCVQTDDVVSAANLGLMRAVEKFEPARGFKFATYCHRRVHGAILDWLRDQDWSSRLGRGRAKLIDDATEQLRSELGHEPTQEQVSRRLGVSPEVFEKFASYSESRLVGSLSASHPVEGHNREVRGADVIPDITATDPASDPNHTSLRDVLLGQFTLSQALIVRMYYQDGMTMNEVGKALRLSESRISQMHSQLIGILKARYTFDGLRELIAEAA